MFTLYVYTYGKKKPFVFELDKASQLNDFYKELNTNDIVKYGPVIFKRSDFLYAVMEEDE